MKIFRELKRRNVFKVGIAYAVTTWILLQLTDIISNIMELPEWAPKLILLILMIGFVPALIFAWAFEMTPEGLKLEKDVVRQKSLVKRTGRKLDFSIIILLGLSLAYFIWESRFEQKTEEYNEASQRIAEQEANPEPEPFMPVREISPENAAINENSIAVLPFTNRSADDNDLYFTDGVHDDLLTQLSKIDAFSVISRTSVMEYRDTTKNLKDIARELSVANVMEGSVQRAGDRVRINVQLIDANTDEHLWAEIYDRELTTNNLFDIQSEIAQSIASALKATLTDSQISTLGTAPTESVEAYDLYLQAKRFALGETRIGYQTALELYEESLKIDPEFALAWVGLAQAHITNYWVYGGKPEDRTKTRDAIDRAKSINADFPELFMAEGFYWYWGHLDYERALYNLKKAIDEAPGNAEAHMWHGWASRRNGQFEQAIASMRESLRLDPRVAFNWMELAQTYTYLHRYDDARNALDRAHKIAPDDFWTKTSKAEFGIRESGDAATAVRLTAGAQHTNEVGFIETFLTAKTFAGEFEEALEAARALTDEMETQQDRIVLREDHSAVILHFMGQKEDSVSAARAGLFRLQVLQQKLGNDYRLDLAEARLFALRGDSPDSIRAAIKKAKESQPFDAIRVFATQYDHARIFALAGMTQDCVATLEPLFSPPSNHSIAWVELDPAFNGIRNEPEFIAMMERHR
ncbi:MAG: TolB-like protein/Tfp pilus assembly protein PilF [Lysobacterales bacterium]|jgi:TolB-like protein/Tfp pilus assembly protein PilF